MADIVSPEQRSKNMAAIRSKDTKPEIYLRKLLFSQGFRYRIASKNILGHPDIFLRKYNTAIFVHGCFWHRHKGCKYTYTPKSRVEFWQKKFDDNIRRDANVKEALDELGIRRLVVWECAIREAKRTEEGEKWLVDKTLFFLKYSSKRYDAIECKEQTNL